MPLCQQHADPEHSAGCHKGILPANGLRPLTELFSKDGKNRTGLEIFFAALALFSIKGKLERGQIAILNRFLLRAREAGLNWLAMEYAQFLCRADKETLTAAIFWPSLARPRGSPR